MRIKNSKVLCFPTREPASFGLRGMENHGHKSITISTRVLWILRQNGCFLQREAQKWSERPTSAVTNRPNVSLRCCTATRWRKSTPLNTATHSSNRFLQLLNAKPLPAKSHKPLFLDFKSRHASEDRLPGFGSVREAVVPVYDKS